MRFKKTANQLFIVGNISTITGFPLIFTLPNTHRPIVSALSTTLHVSNTTGFVGYAVVTVDVYGVVNVNLIGSGSWYGATVYVSLQVPLD